MKPLKDIVAEAIHQVETYKYPQLDEFRNALNPILKAAGIAGSIDDAITSIDQYNDYLRISTEYSVRCCHQTDTIEVPMVLLNAENPVLFAQQWQLNRKLAEATRAKVLAQNTLTTASIKYEQAMTAKIEFANQHGELK